MPSNCSVRLVSVDGDVTERNCDSLEQAVVELDSLVEIRRPVGVRPFPTGIE
jgi:hypothetical protein